MVRDVGNRFARLHGVFSWDLTGYSFRIKGAKDKMWKKKGLHAEANHRSCSMMIKVFTV